MTRPERMRMKRIRAGSSKGMIRTSVALPEDLHRRFKLASIETGAVVTELLRRAAAEWIEKYRKGRSRNS
ncbi:MAG TPA: ribbon-helix-helix protein, CopG family [Candidatus Eisenbacteria bacterium]|nr:ribbon-helix-helix protein, CopG family [Candidatus Eisenbacteria bacterium]HEU4764725.1 ribbon-helix-helix protein, CopG family [Candidatus Eisenbacteria bacterium]